jgi:Cullin family
MRKEWAAYLKFAFQKLLTDEATIAKISFRVIENVLKFKKQSEELIARVFLDKEDNDNFKLALREALEYSLNLNSN